MTSRRSFFKSLLAAVVLSPLVCRMAEEMGPLIQKHESSAPTTELTQAFLDQYVEKLSKNAQRVWEFELLQHMKNIPI